MGTGKIGREVQALWRGLLALDRQTAVVLTVAAVLGMWKYTFGTRPFFARTLAGALGVDAGGLGGYAYTFGTQGLTGFLIPVALLTIGFRRRPGDIGLGLGDWRLGLTLLGLYLPIVTAGAWILSGGASFQQKYPLFQGATQSWQLFAGYELLWLLYWIGWEYLWRGFVLFGTAHTFGRWAIFIQTLPFAALHAQKPIAEAYLSILGGLLLGAVVWRCRSFWIAVPIHFVQMLLMDLFCTLRARSGVQGIGLGSLLDALDVIVGSRGGAPLGP
jgi:uncharacterized protein